MVARSLCEPVRNALRGVLLVGTAALGLSTVSGIAWAGPTTGTAYLNIISSSGIGSESQGTVTLTQISPQQVDVRVSLTSGVKIINTSNGHAHTPFAFNLSSSVSNDVSLKILPISNDSPASFYGPTSFSSLFPDSPYGSFNFAILYKGGNGGGKGNAGDLDFSVLDPNGISLTDFMPNTAGYYFAADVLGTGGQTGAVASDDPKLSGAPADVPEPGSLAILGTGLIGLGLVARRKRRRA